jgi:predicted metal-binding membrane protein
MWHCHKANGTWQADKIIAVPSVAGVFQFTPLKQRCLKQCRSLLSFFVRSYRKGVGAAWRLGLRHGMFCLGSCWALMLVMFGLGVGSLVWMVVLAGVMVVEKTFPGGQRLRPVIGIVLLGLAVLWFVHPTWLLSSVGGV